ncbi:MAG: 50S ribosomal protein L13 [Defluviitaleaceae bacterium]|nr:50S ribosomal protein L13 [Defluviitaleaceae bacterium]
MRTTFITKPLEIERKWYVVDAEGQNLGRLCSEIARVLKGKHKPIYSPHVDAGDYVIVINADKIVVTGKKMDQKKYVRYTGYIGGRRETSLKEMLQKKPEYVITHAVKGMLPKNNLGRSMLKKFHVYAGPTHKHEAQKPEALTFQF